MADITLDRLAQGIRLANAKGDIETVKKLGAAYRKMQGGGAVVAPEGLTPGSKEYALWARDQAIAGNKLPQVSAPPPEYDGPAPHSDIGSKLHAAAGSFIEGVPVAGPTLIDWAKKGRAAVQNMSPEAVDKEFNSAREANPISSGVGGVAGSVLPLLPLGFTQLGGRLLGTVGTTGQRIIAGSTSGATLSGADALARGDDLETAGLKAGLGAGLGALFPVAGALKNKVGQSIAQRSATTAAIKGAPAAAELKATASALFENSRAANAGVKADTFKDFAAGLVQKATKADIDPDLDGQAMAAYRRMVEMANEAAQTGRISLSRLHNLRQLAQDVVIEAKKPRTKNFAGDIVKGLDDLIEGLKPEQMVGAGGKQAANDMLEGISTWSRAKKLSILEEAITQAEFQPSGVTNGLRLKFQAILRNPKTRALFNEAELAEIKRVANGGVVDNIARLIGKFGFGLGNNGNNVVGGSIGLALGGIPGMVAGSAARKGSEILTTRAAERAAKAVATPNLPVLPRLPTPNGVLPPALLPLEITKKREPISITVRGGGR